LYQATDLSLVSVLMALPATEWDENPRPWPQPPFQVAFGHSIWPDVAQTLLSAASRLISTLFASIR